MLDFAITAMCIMYPLNVIIYFYMDGMSDENEHSFFNMLRKHGIRKDRFMSFFSGIIFKGGMVTMLIGFIYLMRLWLW